MRIGITSIKADEWALKDVEDLRKYISDSGHTPNMIYADSLDISVTKGRLDLFQSGERAFGAKEGRERLDVDAVLLRNLGTIRDYEQFMYRLTFLKSFEEKGIFVMNPVLNWLFASDKFGTLMKLAQSNLPVPETVVSEHMFVAYDALRKFKSGVIKPLRSAMGFGVFKVDDPDLGVHVFSYLTNINKPIYVQKYLEKKGGGDYRVVVVGGKVVGSIFRKGINWKSNIAQGATPTKVKPNGELMELALKATEVLGLEYAGIDIAETKDGYFILEANPTFSWQGFKKATGINPAKQIVDHLVKKARS